MNRYSQSKAARLTGQQRLWRAMAAILLLFVSMSLLFSPRVEAALQMSDEALDTLVGPIALYPDDLVAIILPASTQPLQLVQADRFLQKRQSNPKLTVDESWDDSVKALLNYPDIVKTMSTELDWTNALGEAVTEDQDAVLEGIQSFRRRARAAGNLNSDDKQVVVIEKEVIKIVPANPEVIYVPQYVPSTVVVVGVAPVYSYYPTAYPSYYYPYAPGAAFATGLVWGAALGAAWNGGRYVVHYGYGGGNNNINIDRNVNINTGNINRNNINTGNVNTGNINKNNINTGNVNAGNINRSTSKTQSSQRVGDASSSRSATRTQTQPAMKRGASDALGGYSSGQQARASSSRGAASRSSMSGGSRGGGAARGGGRR